MLVQRARYIAGAVTMGLLLGHLLRTTEEVMPAPAAGPDASPPEATASTPPANPPDPTTVQGDSQDALPNFAAWLSRWESASPSERPALEREGEVLACARRIVLKQMIHDDPERALSHALPWATRKRLPPGIARWLETPIAGNARYEVAIACGFGAEGHHDETERWATLNGSTYAAFTYGRRTDVTTKRELSASGIALDDWLALRASPLRVLPDDERRARGLPADGVAVEVLGEFHTLADPASAGRWEAALVAAEDAVDPDAKPPRSGDEPPALQSAYTEGSKTLLYIIADFPNLTGFPQTVGAVSNAMNAVTQYWDEASFRRAGFVPTYVPAVVRLPQSCSYYTNRFSQLLTDARSAALAIGYNYASYDHYVVLTDEGSGSNNFSYAGKAWVGSPGCHLVEPSYTLRTAGHELGHNFGLSHANYWRTDSDHPIGRDRLTGGYVGTNVNAEWIEYGHRFTIMSAQSATDMNDRKAHFAPREKLRLDWVKTNEIVVLTNSATVRLYRFDHRDATGTPRAIHINRPTADYTSYARQYWIGYRMAYTNNGWLRHGVQVDWVRASSYGSDGAVLLDMTPYSNDDNSGSGYTDDNNDKWDGALLLGRTYSDPTNGIHITPVARGGDPTNEWMEVAVHIGLFPSNRAPSLALAASSTQPATGAAVVFQATAADPDGDSLAYEWDFGMPKNLFSNTLNLAEVTNSWSSASEYVVRCVVSDLRGGRASTSLVVTVGNPGTVYRLSGSVLSNGVGVAGVRVYTSHTNMTYTTSDGGYHLVDLPAETYTVQAQAYERSIAPAFANPVAAGPSQSGLHFGIEGAPAVRVTPADLLIAEGAGTSYVVTLASRPTSSVTVVTSTDTGQLQVTGSVVLAPDDWLLGTSVAVSAWDDTAAESDPHTVRVAHAVSSADTAYHLIVAPTVTIAVADNDANTPPELAVTHLPDTAEVPEGTLMGLSVAASDLEDAVTQVLCRVDGAVLATWSAPPYLVAWTAAPPGERVVTAEAWDARSLGATSAPVTVVVLPDRDGDGTPDEADPDDDNDGLPDDFESSHFGHSTGGEPGEDSDVDGFSNLAEYLASTDPTNGASFFHVQAYYTDEPGGVAFVSATGRLYTLQYCAELLAGNTWSNVAGQAAIPGTGEGMTLHDPEPAESRLYRLYVHP